MESPASWHCCADSIRVRVCAAGVALAACTGAWPEVGARAATADAASAAAPGTPASVAAAVLPHAAPAFAPATAGASDAPDSAAARIEALIEAGNFVAAEQQARALAQQREQQQGPQSEAAAAAIDLLVTALRRGRDEALPEARTLAERSLAIRQQRAGADPARIAQSLYNLGLVLRAMDQLPQAQARLEQALALRERALGKHHPDVATTLMGLGNVLQDQHELARAEACYRRAVDIRLQVDGERGKLPAFAMNNLATVLRKQGQLDEARELHRRALQILDGVLAPDDPQLAAAVGNLAALEAELGGYDRARALYQRLVELRERTLGPTHPRLAQALTSLGEVCRALGDPDAARAAMERALAIHEARAPDPKGLAAALNSLANLHESTGDFALARPLYERALELRRSAYGPRDPHVAQALSNLANVVAEEGEPDSAVTLLEQALQIAQDAVRGADPGGRGALEADLAIVLNNLARLHVAAGRCHVAAPLLDQARELQERLFPDGHPDLAETLSNQAACREQQGDRAGAEANLRRALALREAAFGPDHPRVALGLQRLAAFVLRRARDGTGAAAEKDAREGLDLALRAERTSREHLRLTARVQAEREALRYAAERVAGLDLALALCARPALVNAVGRGRGAQSNPLSRTFDQVVRARALVLDEFSGRQQAAVRADDARVRAATERLDAGRSRLAGLLVRGPAGGDLRAHTAALASARDEQERSERALAEVSAAFRRERAASAAGLADVAAALPRGTALVSYVRFRDALEASAPATGEGSVRYFAFVLRGGERTPRGVALGAAAWIDAGVQQWRAAVRDGQTENDGAAAAEAACSAAGDRLRAAVWDPVTPLLGGAKRVLLVPDGALSLVNFAALPAPAAAAHAADAPVTYLIEEGPVLHALSAEREVVAVRARHDEQAGERGRGGLLAVGDPAFDAWRARTDGAPRPGAPASEAPDEAPGTAPGATADCAEFAALRFERLSASAAEVEALAAAWHAARPQAPVVCLQGEAATETAVSRAVRGREVVHLATHGFFLDSACAGGGDHALRATSVDALRGIGAVRRKQTAAPTNPLLLSGLALAGANHRAQAAAGGEDGVLTAQELAGLDLQRVQWAVLSACDTGLGEVQAGEGILGLRRALHLAGAHTVILSLWPVRDRDAHVWMDALYRARLQQGAATADAVHAASLQALRALRAAGSPTPPGRWAAFVAEGDWH